MNKVNGYEQKLQYGWIEQILLSNQPAFDSYIEDTQVSRSAPLPPGVQV